MDVHERKKKKVRNCFKTTHAAFWQKPWNKKKKKRAPRARKEKNATEREKSARLAKPLTTFYWPTAKIWLQRLLKNVKMCATTVEASFVIKVYSRGLNPQMINTTDVILCGLPRVLLGRCVTIMCLDVWFQAFPRDLVNVAHVPETMEPCGEGC